MAKALSKRPTQVITGTDLRGFDGYALCEPAEPATIVDLPGRRRNAPATCEVTCRALAANKNSGTNWLHHELWRV